MEPHRARPGQSLLVGFSLVLASWLLVGGGVFVAQAVADEPPYTPPAEIASEPPAPEGQPSCPDLELEPFEGEDAAAGEVRLLRGESAEACAAISDRLDRLRERTWWVVLEAVKAAQQREAANDRLEQLLEAEEAPTCPAPCPVTIDGEDPIEVQNAAAQQYNDELVSAVDASGEASKIGLWFVAGLIVAGLIGALIARSVDRGT